MSSLRIFVAAALCAVVLTAAAHANGNVYVSRFWHNHQPLYWPEWNNNGDQKSRVQYAWDSIVMKPGQNYGGLSPKQHPENNLTDIFGLDDRRTSYQSGPRNSLAGFNSAGGFAISYSGSLIDNVRQLGSVGQLGYGSGWNDGYKEARGWKTPAGSTRMDLVGFTYHHSLAPLLPKSVFRKELQIFKQAWWKAWGGKSDSSDHSRGFFPTEMGYSRHLIDVLAEEGYQWVIVASHHISRTCPTYMGDPRDTSPETGAWKIFSSPPNKADQLGPSPTSGWWYGEPNPGNAARNVSPFAYQLHRVKYVNPQTGVEKTMIAVPSDDVLSYRYGYANEGIGKIGEFILPFATDPARPVMVMPSTDGDNAWGGGSSSWNEATPQLFNGAAAAGYKPSTPQDFVNAFGGNAPMTHIEDGAWIFPEMCYGSPNFMKWIEPPVATVANRGVTTVPGTQIDMETPGFALKFYSYAPLMAGANWVETAEQILRDEGGSVQAWKIQAPYDWNGAWTSPNDVELAWHIYLKGLDSGFNYYGGLGNDDEMKPGLATRRAVEKLTPWMTTERRNNDRTGPTVLKPQRFPYNPGGFTFGWFNQQPQIPNNAFLKRMNSEFYIWTHAYDLNGIPEGNVKLMIRIDANGTNPLNSNQNETYAGGSEVGQWVPITMDKRELPKTREALNAAAANSQIDYFLPVQAEAVADYYFAKITNDNLPNFRNKLLDYYIEATDAKGNTSKSEIQHVWVDDYSGQTNAGGGSGGGGDGGASAVSVFPAPPVAGQPVTITYNPAGRPLASATNVYLHYAPGEWNAQRVIPRPALSRTNIGTAGAPTNVWRFVTNLPAGSTILRMVFTANPETSQNLAWDNNGGADWNIAVSNAPSTNPPTVPAGLAARSVTTDSVSLTWSASTGANGYIIYRGGVSNATTPDTNFVDSTCQPDTSYSYTVAATNLAGTSPLSAPTQVRTLFLPVGLNNIRVVNPAFATTNAGPSCLFSGHAGLALTNGLVWSNAANGRTGVVPFSGATNSSGWSWSASIDLAGGVNALTFSASYPTNLAPQTTGEDSPDNYSAWPDSSGGTGFGGWLIAGTNGAGGFLADLTDVLTLAFDAAANYASSWTNGATAGSGFGTWSLGGAGDHAFLLGDPVSAVIGGFGSKTFRLRGRGTNGGNYAAAERPLNLPLSAGQTLAFRWGINWDCGTTNGHKGFVILSGRNEIVNVDNGSTEKITFNGTDIGFGYGTNSMRWVFKMLSANSLEASSIDRDGEGTFKTNIVVSGPPTAVRFYAANMEPDSRREPYFDELRVEGSYDNLSLGEVSKGFGLYAESGKSVSARRSLPDAMKAGDSFSVYLDNNWIEEKGEVGLAVRDASGVDRMRFYFVGGEFSYRIDDAVAGRDTKIGYTSGGMPVTFVLDSANSYTLRVGPGSLTGVLAGGGDITQFAVFNKGAGPGTERNFYVGEMTVTARPTTNALVSVAAPPVSLSTTDSIPDTWWQAYGIPENERNPGQDRDGDGFTNAQEYALGTDPTNSASSFRITSIVRNGTNTTVSWSSVAGKSYQLQGKPNLGILNWTNFASPVTASSNSASAVHQGTAAEHFYRVILSQ